MECIICRRDFVSNNSRQKYCNKKCCQRATYLHWKSSKSPEEKRKYWARYTPDKLSQLKELRKKIFEIYGCKCIRCGYDNINALALDHVKNDGAQERANKTSKKIYQDAIIRYNPDKYQILCMNCNWLKRLGMEE